MRIGLWLAIFALFALLIALGLYNFSATQPLFASPAQAETLREPWGVIEEMPQEPQGIPGEVPQEFAAFEGAFWAEINMLSDYDYGYFVVFGADIPADWHTSNGIYTEYLEVSIWGFCSATSPFSSRSRFLL